MRQSQSLTLTSNGGLLRVIQSPCRISAGFDPAAVAARDLPAMQDFAAIWDTGATNCVITAAVVERCGLRPTGITQTAHAQGTAQAETFLVNIGLPNGVAFANVRVTLGVLQGADALIGMDIITAGDFSITNVSGLTVCSFRVPSLTRIDYVAEANKQNLWRLGTGGGLSGGRSKGRRHGTRR